MEKPVTFPMDSYEDHVDNHHGICSNCGEVSEIFTASYCEDGHCDRCGQKTVQGFEQALLNDVIDLEDHVELEEESE